MIIVTHLYFITIILSFTVHSGVVGLVIAPLMLLGGPLIMRAATYTLGTVAALSLTAACAPDEKFLNWGGPLSLGLGGICVASLGKGFLLSSILCSHFWI